MISIHKRKAKVALSIILIASFIGDVVHAKETEQPAVSLPTSAKREICRQLDSKDYVYIIGEAAVMPGTKISLGDFELNEDPQADERLKSQHILLVTRSNIVLNQTYCENSVCVSEKKKIASICPRTNAYRLTVTLDPSHLGIGAFNYSGEITLFNEKEQYETSKPLILSGHIHGPHSELVFSTDEVSSFLAGRSNTLTVSIRNVGDRVLKIREFSEIASNDTTPAQSAQISVNKNTCVGKELEPTQTCVLKFQRQGSSRQSKYEIAFGSNDVVGAGRLMMYTEPTGKTGAGIWR